MSWTRKLNLFYRGDRDYLQGSLITAQAVRLWRETVGDGRETSRLVKVNFTDLIRYHCLVTEKQEVSKTKASGELVFETLGRPRTVLLILPDAEARRTPSRRPDTPSRIMGYSPSGEGKAKVRITPSATFEEFITATIEANKKWHLEIFPGSREIWFLSLFDTAWPLVDGTYWEVEALTIENQRTGVTGGRKMTLNKLTCHPPQSGPVEFKLLFSFKG